MRTRYLIMLILACLFQIQFVSSQTNKLYIPPTNCPFGKTTNVEIQMDNQSEVVALQFNLHIPDVVTLDKSGMQLAEERKDDHKLSVTDKGGNNYLVIVMSMDNKPFKNASGALIKIPLVVPDGLEIDKEYPFQLSNVVLSDRSGKNVMTSFDAGKIKIVDGNGPDITPTDIQLSSDNFQPGGKVSLAWNVENIGGKPSEDGWSEQLYLVDESGNEYSLGKGSYNEIIGAKGKIARRAEYNISEFPGIEGKVQAKVVLTAFSEWELPVYRENNEGVSKVKLDMPKVLTWNMNETSIQEKGSPEFFCTLKRSGSRNSAEVFNIKNGNSSRLQLPGSVTIPEGESGVSFKMKVIDDTVANSDSFVVATVTGDRYEKLKKEIWIEDDEHPYLKISVNQDNVAEGKTFTITVEREWTIKWPLVVKLSSDHPKRFDNWPAEVIIPENANKKEVTIRVKDDDLPGLDDEVVFTASAPGHVFDLTCKRFIKVLDNDVPNIELMLSTSTASEAGQVITAKLKRKGVTDNKITVDLTHNGGNRINIPSTIVLEAGISEKEFAIQTVDNAMKDGDQTVTIKGAIYISSCNCSTAGTTAGVFEKQITVLDDDDAAVKSVVSKTTLLEGETGKITISVNEVLNRPLSINLSSDSKDLQFASSATIEAGKSSVDVDVKVSQNSVSEGNRVATVVIDAGTYGKSTCWLNITDQTLPDAVVTTFETEKNITVQNSVTVSATVKNEGAAVLPAQTKVSVYLSTSTGLNSSATALGSLYTQKELAVGESETLSKTMTFPDNAGAYYLIAIVNEDQSKKELSYVNNNATPFAVQLKPLYTVQVSLDKTVLKTGESVTINGQVSGSKIANVPVDLYIINNGYRDVVKVTTDNSGFFQTSYTPKNGFYGHFAVGACYPDEGLEKEMTGFDLYGLKKASYEMINWEVFTNEKMSGHILLKNPGNKDLSGITAKIISQPKNCTISFSSVSNLAVNKTAELRYEVIGTAVSTGVDWEPVKVQVSSKEGAILDLDIRYYCRSHAAQLEISEPNINTTMTIGSSREYPVTITNTGKGETGEIRVVLPDNDWMSLATPAKMASLKYGESATVLLRLAPNASMEANIANTGRFAINCANGNGVPVSYRITPVSSEKGTLIVDVCDEYTYYTAEKPHVRGADVRVTMPNSNTVVAEGKTDANGLFTSELPSGSYTVEVKADKHDSYKNTVLVDPGKENEIIVNLSTQAITIDFEVEQVDIEDAYELNTVVKYDVSVPAPIITMEIPEALDITSVREGDVMMFNIILTNQGLITAEDVQLIIPENSGTLVFEPMVTEFPLVLKSKQSITIPVKVTRQVKQDTRSSNSVYSDPCVVYFETLYSYPCGDRKYILVKAALQLGVCKFIIPGYRPSLIGGILSGIGGNLGLPGMYNKSYPYNNKEEQGVTKKNKCSKEDEDEGNYSYDDNEYKGEPDSDPKPGKLTLKFKYGKGYFNSDLKYFKNHAIKGVAADGVSVIRIKVGNIPEDAVSYSFELCSDAGEVESILGTVDNLSGEIQQLYDQALNNYNILYTAPSEFPVSLGKEYKVRAKMIVYGGNGSELADGEIDISIIRPPVLMTHGLNDNAGCFLTFARMLQNSGKYQRFQFRRSDYSATNKDYFIVNKDIIKDNLEYLMLSSVYNGYIATKADLIGHSMGGILSRIHAQYVDNISIHKIITLNTPHSGSQGANLIMSDPIFKHIAWWVFYSPEQLKKYGVATSDYFERTYTYWRDFITKNEWSWCADFGAISDLQVGSTGMEFLNNSQILNKVEDISVHAVATTYNLDDIFVESTDGFTTWLYKLLEKTPARKYMDILELVGALVLHDIDASALILDHKYVEALDVFFKKLYDGDSQIDKAYDGVSDLIVAYESQLGGLSNENITHIEGSIEKTNHLASPQNETVHKHLLNLLLLPSSDKAFSKRGFKPTNIKYTYSPIKPFEKSELNLERQSKSMQDRSLPEIQIEDLGNRRIKIRKVISSDIVKSAVVLIAPMLDSYVSFEDEFVYEIPGSFKGDLNFIVIGSTIDESIISNTVSYTVKERKSLPVSIAFVDEQYTVFTGKDFIPHVICTWNDGSESYIEPIYVIEGDYASVINGTVRGKEKGNVILKASFENLSCEVPVYVKDHKIIEADENDNIGVCSSISLQFSNSMIMTRQAFRGTLTVNNGHTSISMKDIKLDLIVSDEDGIVATEHEFEISLEKLDGFCGNLDGVWTLDAQKTGTASILFIPTKYAAPTEPKDYTFGGTLSYIDPFTGLEVTRDLFPVTLTVKLSPNLKLTYFVQRDILGDDPLTPNKVEPSVPAEFSLLIQNTGAGDATKVNMITNQPKIVDNEKGLAIDFELLNSVLNGEEKSLALGGSVATNFGTIPAGQTAYAQWWFTSTLLGNFETYKVEATHVTSYDNPNLSLLDGEPTIHELIRSIKVPKSDLAGFLVNDLEDDEYTPDMIYLTDGTIETVSKASAKIEKNGDQYTLTATPSTGGWSYGSLTDPTGGRQKLVSIIRQDGQMIDLLNVWQTSCTVRNGKAIYENRIHFADKINGNTTYKLTFEPGPDVILEVASFDGIPANNEVAEKPVTEITVHFNKAIEPETFTTEDLTLVLQGQQRDASPIHIKQKDKQTFVLDLTEVSKLDGFYVLTVQTAGITDYEGFLGESGKNVSWTQYLAPGYQTLSMELASGWNWISTNMEGVSNPVSLLTPVKEKVKRMQSQSQEVTNDPQLGLVGNLDKVASETFYKLEMNANGKIDITGTVLTPSQVEIGLKTGWNWIGYIPRSATTPTKALALLTANVGDEVKGQAGFAQFNGSTWVGTLDKMEPGKGYMYKAAKSQTLQYPIVSPLDATVSLRSVDLKSSLKSELKSPWTVDIHKYPNNMSVIANLWLDEVKQEPDQYVVAAFCGDECRGIGKYVDDKLFITIYGDKAGENITFRAALNGGSSQWKIKETVSFSETTQGTLTSPFDLHLSEQTTGNDIILTQNGIYPNPVSRLLYIKGDTEDIRRVQVVGGNGAVLMKQGLNGGNSIDVSPLSSGLYILVIERNNNNKPEFHKFIKK